MSKAKINPLLFIGLIGIITIGGNFAVQLHRVFGADQDIWWTPNAEPLAIEETNNSFRVSIGGKLLQDHCAEGTLSAVDGNGKQYRVVPQDISVRINNWHEVKSSILSNALFSAVAFGIVLAVLVIGLVQVFGRNHPIEKPGPVGTP